MSGAFVKEGDAQWLHDVLPTLNSLLVYLASENNGIQVYEKKSRIDNETGSEIYEMSNGLEYMLDKERKWTVIN